MFGTKASEVRALLADQSDSIPVEPFIRSAHSKLMWLYAHCTGMSSMTDDDLTIVEAWLAAHYYAQKDPQYLSKSTGGASGSFQGQVGKYFESTWYGQRAIELDHSGCLARLQSELISTSQGGGKRVASIHWAGKVPSEQIDYVERD